MRVAKFAVVLLIAAPLSTLGDEAGFPHHRPVVNITNDGRALKVGVASTQSAKRVEILSTCGNPAVGPHRVRSFIIGRNAIDVTYGKHCFARVSLPDLGLSCVGCD